MFFYHCFCLFFYHVYFSIYCACFLRSVGFAHFIMFIDGFDVFMFILVIIIFHAVLLSILSRLLYWFLFGMFVLLFIALFYLAFLLLSSLSLWCPMDLLLCLMNIMFCFMLFKVCCIYNSVCINVFIIICCFQFLNKINTDFSFFYFVFEFSETR